MSTKNYAVVAFSLLASAATAQQQDTSSRSLEDVFVTANKVEQKQGSTAKVITVISKATLEKSGTKSLAQVLNEQAGITINGALNNAGSVQTVYMRGASSGRTQILLDGIPVNDPSQINNDFDLNLFSINDVERVEICSGAQSTLYGSDAIAGVINIITIKKDISKPINFKTTLTAGSFNTFKSNAQAFGKLGKLTYNARVSRLKTNGFSAAYDSSGKGNFDNNKYDGRIANLSLQYQFSKAFSTRIFAQQSNYKTNIDDGSFRDEKDQTSESKNKIAGLSMQYKTDLVTVTANYQYSDVTRTIINDSFFVPTGAFGKYSSNAYFGKTQFAELFANINMGKHFRLLQGGDFRFSNMNNQYLSISSFGPYKSQFKDTVMSQNSLFSSLYYTALNGKLNIELGGRLNVHSRYGSNQTFTFNPSYTINEQWRIFGSVASGFKAPSLYQIYDAFSGNRNLLAEESKNYELGIQFNNKEKLQARAIYFSRNIDNGIDYNNQTFKYFNYVKQLVSGIELQIAARPTKQLSINANYTYLAFEETSQSRITLKDTTYNYLLKRPTHTLNCTIGYQVTPKLFASIHTRVVSERKDFGGYKKADANLPAYTIFNLYAGYKLANFGNVFIDAQNLLNKKFFEVYGYNSIPFMLNAGFSIEL